MKSKFRWRTRKREDIGETLRALDIVAVQKKYKRFHTLLEEHDRLLKVMSSLEEKLQSRYLVDIHFIEQRLQEIQIGIKRVVDSLNQLADNRYVELYDVIERLKERMQHVLPGGGITCSKDDFTIPLHKITRDNLPSVGSKNAQLGELRNRLGLPVPDGFAISAWACQHFMQTHNLSQRLLGRLHQVDFVNHADIVAVSRELQEMIQSTPVPEDLAASILNSYHQLRQLSSTGFVALRSSAIGEDSEHSFAGQYRTFLNIGEDTLLERYREIVASKFSPKSIYYCLTSFPAELDQGMAVSCLCMVDALVSGVMYTRNPVHPVDDTLMINAVYGLGAYLVSGEITPDVLLVSRETGHIREMQIARKPVRLVPSATGGTVEEPVEISRQCTPSINETQAAALVEMALRIERHYNCPQDIEWALDRDGRIYILQTRPLRVVQSGAGDIIPDVSEMQVLRSGGTTVCPGAGAGKIFFARSADALPSVPEGAVLVTPHPLPGLIIAMNRVSAIITEMGSSASHMATLAREKNIPTLVNVPDVAALPVGQQVTVDATGRTIYAGVHESLIAARRASLAPSEKNEIHVLLENLLSHISPLHLFDPTDADFVPENCETVHDLIRFVHQKSHEETFGSLQSIDDHEKVVVWLKTDIPLPLKIIFIDELLWKYLGKEWITEDEIESIPMRAFWAGIKEEGWPSVPQIDLKGFSSVVSTHFIKGARQEFLESSFAVLAKHYMLINIRMGYHFSSVKARCTDEPEKNFIYMQYKEGGAALDRRIRRIKLIKDLLVLMGFENFSKGDFLHAGIACQRPQTLLKKLHIVGRISMLTKQLDMVLSSDAIARRMTEDFILKLGIDHYVD